MLPRSLKNIIRRARRPERGRWLAAAYLAVALGAAVLSLALGHRERMGFLYYPRDWGYRSLLAAKAAAADNLSGTATGQSVGGAGVSILPLDFKRYVVKEGDTLSAIAERLGLDLDTIASLNRQWGSGVHLVRVGEEIRVPNQDGIYLPAEPDLEKMCADRGVPAEAVLAVNRLGPGEVKRGQPLFFPGVQHRGIERSVVVGTAFLRPVLDQLRLRLPPGPVQRGAPVSPRRGHRRPAGLPRARCTGREGGGRRGRPGVGAVRGDPPPDRL
jgi:LysM repeat protein